MQRTDARENKVHVDKLYTYESARDNVLKMKKYRLKCYRNHLESIPFDIAGCY